MASWGSIGWVVGGALAVAFAIADAVTLRRLWASPMFDRGQKIAQTVIVCLVPGAFAVTRYLLNPPPSEPRNESTVANPPESPYADAASHLTNPGSF